MSRKYRRSVEIPSRDQVKTELDRLNYKREYKRVILSTIYGLLVVAAVAVLLATLLIPVMQVSGTSMSPTLQDGDILCLLKSDRMNTGDLCGFYWQNKLLIKRIIAGPGEVVEIGPDGTVKVNGTVIEEEYVQDKAMGECDLEFPYQVPESRFFVMGDHRSTSIDSRSSVIGCVETDQMVGRVAFRIWPFDRMGLIG